MAKELPAKQKAFADYYIQSLNGAESYKKAYPTCKTDGTARANASKLLANANIQSYIEVRMAEKESNTIASANEVLEFLTASMRSDNMADKERVKCAELLGKRYRLFIDKVEADVSQTVIFEGENELED